MPWKIKVLALLSVGVSAYAVLAYAFLPPGNFVHPNMQVTFQQHPFAIYTHVFASAVALLLGPFQFIERLRRASAGLHRAGGRVYLLMIVLGGMSGLQLARFAQGGLPGRLGFAVLALAWLYSGYRAFSAIRQRHVVEHRLWMVRNFALTFAAVTLRLQLGMAGALGIPFEWAYPLVSWLCWVPNLCLVELFGWGRGPAGGTMAIQAS